MPHTQSPVATVRLGKLWEAPARPLVVHHSISITNACTMSCHVVFQTSLDLVSDLTGVGLR